VEMRVVSKRDRNHSLIYETHFRRSFVRSWLKEKRAWWFRSRDLNVVVVVKHDEKRSSTTRTTPSSSYATLLRLAALTVANRADAWNIDITSTYTMRTAQRPSNTTFTNSPSCQPRSEIPSQGWLADILRGDFTS